MIPIELQGEVQKFEDAVHSIVEYHHYGGGSSDDIINSILRCKDFYNQNFKTEMIEEYFESKTNIKLVAKNLITEYVIQKRTLSDFIDACLNSDIKLTWRAK